MLEAAQSSVITRSSRRSVAETVDRLKRVIADRGFTLFRVIDHSGTAEGVGVQMPDSKLVMFGNPAKGAAVMLAAPLAGTLFTILILLSEIPNTIVKRASERKDLPTVRRYLWVMTAIGVALIVIRAYEFRALHIWWYDNAYGSIIWTLLFLHLTHILTDFVDTVVLTAIVFTRQAADDRRMVDVSENAMYWRFVWLLWIPIYLMIYWIPRWVS